MKIMRPTRQSTLRSSLKTIMSKSVTGPSGDLVFPIPTSLLAVDFPCSRRPRLDSVPQIETSSGTIRVGLDQISQHFAEGLMLYQDFLTSSEEEELMLVLEDPTVIEWRCSQSGRRKCDFGPKVNYRDGTILCRHGCIITHILYYTVS